MIIYRCKIFNFYNTKEILGNKILKVKTSRIILEVKSDVKNKYIYVNKAI